MGAAAPAKTYGKRLSPAANAWVETTLRKMTADEKIGQLLFIAAASLVRRGGIAACHRPARSGATICI